MTDTKPGDVVRKVLSLMAVLLFLLTLVGLFVMKGRGIISGDYFLFYSLAGGVCLFLATIAFISDFAVKYLVEDNLLARAFFIYERSKLRPGSLFGGIPAVVFIALGALVFFLLLGSDFTFLHTPNPYAQSFETGLTQEALSQHGAFENWFLGAWVPGLFEEGLWFFSIQATIFLLMLAIWLIVRDDDILENPGVFWGITVVALFVWSALFALAHGRFGGNQELFIFAGVFEFMVQTLNMLTGSFGSVLVHVAHNSAVVARNSFSFLLAALIPFFRVEWLRWRFPHE